MPLILYAAPVFPVALLLLAILWIGSAISDRNAGEAVGATLAAVGMFAFTIWMLVGVSTMHTHMASHEPAAVVGQP